MSDTPENRQLAPQGKLSDDEYNVYQFMHEDPLTLSDGQIDALVAHLRAQRVEFFEMEKAGKTPRAKRGTAIQGISGAALDNILGDLAPPAPTDD